MKKQLFLLGASLLLALEGAQACSRITFVGHNGEVLTGRTMDWIVDDDVSLRLMAPNVVRKSVSPEKPFEWKSKYGSVIVVSFNESLNSGMNQRGFVVDSLWLSSSDYGELKANEKHVAANEFVLYLLDNFATVREAVDALKAGGVRIFQDKVPGTDKDLKLHFMITDKTGNNAILEYIDGQLNVYEKKGVAAMTNDPSFDKMQAIEKLYRDRDLFKNMPGTSLAVDRYVRALGWAERISADAADFDKSIPLDMRVLSIMRTVSSPLGFSSKNNPQNCMTLWRSVADTQNGTITVDSSFGKTAFTIRIGDLSFKEDGQVIHLRALKRDETQDITSLAK